MDNRTNTTVNIPSVIKRILKGLGQIMLQENAITGLLFLAGIFFGSAAMGAAALLAVICGTLTARVLSYEAAEIDEGLYGFSAALTGVALALFFKPVPIIWAVIVLASALAAVVQHFFIKRKLPVYTLPFVLVTWLAVYLLKNFAPELSAVPSAAGASPVDHFLFAVKGFGQVIFQEKPVSGALFFTAVFISSPVAALYGLVGAMLSGILSWYMGAPVEVTGAGLYGFNAVLCAIVFSGPRIRDGVWVLISVLLSLAISMLMLRHGLVQLTFPFVAATVISLIFKRLTGFLGAHNSE
ncbi:MAG TPA: urea transporter [Spirochaetota bacterium]|nr:MAG: Urea transporter [Spirochaetes bacterium ADurb.BinA120]HNU92216.1 urea transporter [Spirochaetota bacterium]HPI15673.1 urea transporter [Spirochaetota bacterium]HPO45641.1 urea transporter [Spirochaetota bacterium]